MRSMAALAVSLLCALNVAAIQNVSRAGRYLYTEDGNRFYIKGIAYQEQGAFSTDPNEPFLEPSSFIDPLSDGKNCTRDLPFLQQLGVNTIRAYSVNSSLNHDDCMQALSGAGIYTIIDLTLPVNGSINRASPSWSTDLLDLYLQTIDTFSKYDNVLAYNVGNEVVTSSNETAVAPFIKAATRDVKAYLKSKGLNTLVGYAAVDAPRDWLDALASYLACDSEEDSLDLYGLNNYEWCGDSSFQASYSDIEGQFAGYNIPAYFSEFGCITSPPRLWTEVQALFSNLMSPVWSGGLAFSYFPATSSQGQFGMVNISADGQTVSPNDDFDRLVTQYTNATGPNSPSQSSAGATNFPTCPTQNSTFLASTTLPPTPNITACNCVVSQLSCQFTPTTSNTVSIVGDLIGQACGLLAGVGGSCDDIASDGQAGTYGRFAFCSADAKLAFIMTAYYEATNRNAQSCNFGGNATINTAAPSSASALNSAVSQCLSNTQTTFTPSLPSTGTTGGSSGGSSSGGSSGSPRPTSGTVKTVGGLESVAGLLIALAFSVVSGVWVLAL